MEDFFRIYRGLELDDSSQFLTGSTSPSSADADAAPRGSFYTNTSDGSFWVKINSGAGAGKWAQLATQAYVQNLQATGISWREPADLADTTSASLAAIEGLMNAGDSLQGVTVAAGTRILCTAVAGTPKNIYIVGGVTGNWTLTEDVNVLSPGDSVYVDQGTSAGKTFQYSGTGWVWVNQADADEQAFLRTFVGKAGSGAVVPTYSSVNIVTQGASLEGAIGELDAEAGYVDLFTGKLAGSVLPTYTSNNVVANNDSLRTAISKIDTAIGVHVVNGTAILAANEINANITALDTEMGSIESFLGKIVGTGTPVYTSQTFVTNGDSIQTAIGKIDGGLTEVGKKVTASGITTVTTIDSIAGARLAEWDVYVADAANALNVYVVKILAAANGTDVDYTKFSVLKLGASVPGVAVTADFVGGAMRLRVASPTSVNVVSKRLTSFL